MTCRLCGASSPLREGHVVPAAIFRWLKKTSGTGHLRNLRQPNKRIQDGPKQQLLCGSCEQRFGTDEQRFVEKFFLPIVECLGQPLRYDEWLIRCVVSMSWRVLWHWESALQDLEPERHRLICEMRDQWGQYLSGEIASPGRGKHHCFILDHVNNSGDPDRAEKLDWYNLRAVDLAVALEQSSTAVYLKLPGLVFWSCIDPASPAGWTGTQINRRGQIHTPQQVTNLDLGTYMMRRFGQVYLRRQALSPRQQQVVDETVAKNPDRHLQSESFRMWKERQEMNQVDGASVRIN